MASNDVCEHQNANYLRMMSERDELRAEVERLRREVAAGIETERGSNATARRLLAEAREQVADLRGQIEALPTWRLVDGSPVVRRSDLRALLAESGEQPGEVYGPRPTGCCGKCPPIEGGGYDCTCEGNPRCVRERVRDVFVNAERRESFGGTDIDALTDAVLAVVGQGVTVEWGVGYGDRHEAAPSREDAEEWIADDDAWNPGEERWLVTRQVGLWTRAAVRPSGQEGS